MSLSQRILSLTRKLDPETTGVRPQIRRLEPIRAVAFDIYGTLVISGSGDIGLVDETARESAMNEALAAVGLEAPAGRELSARFYELVRAAQASSQADFPEVEIREVWRSLLAEIGAPASAPVEELAVDYECRTNPVWPMPGLEETLAGLRERGLSLGIVSNAQFYTPHLFQAFLGRSLEDLGFPREHQVYSFELLEGKPSTRLYQRLARHLDPATTLYLGNDMLKDIWPASRAGFRTALFAGDARSLRWRADDPRVADTTPDLILTELPQILECLP